LMVLCLLGFDAEILFSAQSENSSSTPSPFYLGFIQVQPSQNTFAPSGVELVQSRSNGILISEAGFPLGAPIQSGRLSVDVSSTTNTGIALANPNGQPAMIWFYFTSPNGTDFGQGSFFLPPRHQLARFLTET